MACFLRISHTNRCKERNVTDPCNISLLAAISMRDLNEGKGRGQHTQFRKDSLSMQKPTAKKGLLLRTGIVILALVSLAVVGFVMSSVYATGLKAATTLNNSVAYSGCEMKEPKCKGNPSSLTKGLF